jgi:DNA-binding NarL/FixJ family response regulator
MRLLIVDDQALIRDGLVTICERLPAVEVVGISHGRQPLPCPSATPDAIASTAGSAT